MEAGRLRHRITIQYKVVTRDELETAEAVNGFLKRIERIERTRMLGEDEVR